MKVKFDEMPTHTLLLLPALNAIKRNGGRGTNAEIEKLVLEFVELSDELRTQPHKTDKPNGKTEFNYSECPKAFRFI